MPSEKSRVRRIPVAMPADDAPRGRFRNMRFSGFTLVMLGVIVLFVVALAPSLKTLIQQQEQIAQKERDVASQKSDLAKKRKDVARWNDPAYIEAQARDRLLYVYPGEESYLVMNPSDGGSGTKTTTDSGSPVSAKVQTGQVDWVSAMLSSVLKAGLSDESSHKLVSPDVSGSGKAK